MAGLNPHAGEDGLFGDEEGREIIPAIEAARAEGLNVTGPLPADTLFSRARGGEFDIVVAMYHDQGHIPVKTLGFEYDEATKKWTGLSGVNVTVGLPFLRVSVDHGTAFDRAWKGIANHESMVEALELAADDAEEGLKPWTSATIRSLIRDVKAGRLTRRRFVQIMVGLGLTAPHGRADARRRRRGRAAQGGRAGLHADQARRRRPAEGALVAGARRCSIRTSPPAPRTRTARASSTSRWPRYDPDGNLVAGPRRRDPEHGQRRRSPRTAPR